jgi:F-type H+-transporting ATPase subunit epsilon
MATFAASLVLPEQVLLEEEVQSVSLRTDDGDAAFLPGHSPLIGAVVPGAVRFVHEDGTEKRFEVERGLVRVEPDRVVVLVPAAEASST